MRRLLNVYHPYDPVAHRSVASCPYRTAYCLLAGLHCTILHDTDAPNAQPCDGVSDNNNHPWMPPVSHWCRALVVWCRIEPLAHPAAETQRAAFLPLFKGGKRIHLAVQEFSEDVGSAASRFGTSLLSSLAFSKFKGSASYKAAHQGGEGSTSAATTAAAAAEATQAEAEAVQAEAEAAESIAEEAEAARLMAQKSAPSLKGGGDSLINADQEEHPQLYESLSFGAMDRTTAQGALFAAEPAMSPSRHQQQLQQQVAAPSPRGGRGSFSGIGTSGVASGIARVSDGVAVPGSKLGKGRIDFVMQARLCCATAALCLCHPFLLWAARLLSL